MKLKSGLVKEVHEKEEFIEEQQKIKTRHGIEDDNVVVVEKRMIIKSAIALCIHTIQFIAKILLIILAFIGLVAIVYPEPRNELLQIVSATINQVKEFIH